MIRRSRLFRNSDEELRRLEREAIHDPMAAERLRHARHRSDPRQIAFDAGFRAMLSGRSLPDSLSDASQGMALEHVAGHEAALTAERVLIAREAQDARNASALRHDAGDTYLSLEDALATVARGRARVLSVGTGALRDLAARAVRAAGGMVIASGGFMGHSYGHPATTQAHARMTLGLVRVEVTRAQQRGIVWLDPTTLDPVQPPVITAPSPSDLPEPPGVPPRAELAGNSVLKHQLLAAARSELAAPDLAASLLPELRELFPQTNDSIMRAIIRAQLRTRERRLDPMATEREVLVFVAGDTLPGNFRWWHGGGGSRTESATRAEVHVLRPAALVIVSRDRHPEERVWIKTPLWLKTPLR